MPRESEVMKVLITPPPVNTTTNRMSQILKKVFFNSTGLIQTESTVDLLAGLENGRMALFFTK